MTRESHLGLDPGTKNMAACVVIKNGAKLKIQRSLMLNNPLRNLTMSAKRDKNKRTKQKDGTTKTRVIKQDDPPFNMGVNLFTDEIVDLLEQDKITHVTIERFQTRGLGGSTIEAVGVMIGIVAVRGGLDRNVVVIPTTAATWKLALGRAGIDLKELYRYGKMYFKLEPHPIDAMFMALYSADPKGIKRWATRKAVDRLAAVLGLELRQPRNAPPR